MYEYNTELIDVLGSEACVTPHNKIPKPVRPSSTIQYNVNPWHNGCLSIEGP